jgi:hypothetical protein
VNKEKQGVMQNTFGSSLETLGAIQLASFLARVSTITLLATTISEGPKKEP